MCKVAKTAQHLLLSIIAFLANDAVSAVTIYPGTEASTTPPSPATCVFKLSGRGDFQYPTPDSMVVDVDDGSPLGTVLTAGDTVGPSSTWDSQAYFAFTTDGPGPMTAPQTAFFGLRCEVSTGSYKYGWVKFTEGVNAQSIDCFALEGTADTAITIDDSQCPSGNTSSDQTTNIYFDFNEDAPTAATPVPTLPFFWLLALGGLLGLFSLRKLKK